MAAPLELISHRLCPYVQRAVIALAEKGVPFERVDIDLANKPDWFLALSPLGKTPVLLVGDVPIFESAVILEYLEETQPKPLHPADPLRRAEHRAWIEFGSAVLSDIAGLYAAPDQAGPTLDVATRTALRAAGSARRGRAVVRRRKLLAGRRRVWPGVPLFRCIRRDRRFRHSRRQAQAGALAASARVAAIGAHGRQRGLPGAAARLHRAAEFLAVRAAGACRGLVQRTLASRMSR